MYLICCGGYDGNGKSKYEGNTTCKEKPPPWQLDLFFQGNAHYERDSNSHSKQKVKPPFRYVFVLPHQPCVYVILATV